MTRDVRFQLKDEELFDPFLWDNHVYVAQSAAAAYRGTIITAVFFYIVGSREAERPQSPESPLTFGQKKKTPAFGFCCCSRPNSPSCRHPASSCSPSWLFQVSSGHVAESLLCHGEATCDERSCCSALGKDERVSRASSAWERGQMERTWNHQRVKSLKIRVLHTTRACSSTTSYTQEVEASVCLN